MFHFFNFIFSNSIVGANISLLLQILARTMNWEPAREGALSLLGLREHFKSGRWDSTLEPQILVPN